MSITPAPRPRRPASHQQGSSQLHQAAGARTALTIEHRAAASSNGITLRLLAQGDGLALHVDDQSPADPPDVAPSAIDRVEAILANAPEPLPLRAVRAAVKLRAATVSDALAALVTQGRAIRSGTGYAITER
jgi:predicted Rossmann fold nucleotide-binding protein DprA/Smf involved in DNA uptake